MIKRLRLNFIAIAMGALLLLMLSIFLTLNIYMKQVTVKQVDGFLQNVMDNDGLIRDQIHDPREGLPPGPDDQLEHISGFSIFVSLDGTRMEVISSQGELTDEVMSAYALQVFDQKEYRGDVESYRYLAQNRGDGFLMVFGSTRLQNVLLSELLKLSYVMGAISVLLLLIIIILMSGLMTKPVEEAFVKQKRFIADSSHELKTPVAILSANLDMLEMEIGPNSRTIAMKKGIKRMNTLIHELIILAKTEDTRMTFMPFNLSKAMESTLLPFEAIAYEQNNTIELKIEENVELKGNEEGIRKMIGALMENAVKYARTNTVIKAKLYTKGDQKVIEIFNEGIGVTKEQKSKLFDKFYRVDHSRNSETGGHGIGLSIAKNIVDLHHGKITVESEPDVYILFKVILHG